MNADYESLKNKIFQKSLIKDDIEQISSQLEFLCNNFDPFIQPNEEELSLLKKFSIDHIKDPFILTNTLVYLTEEAINLKRHQLH